MNNIATVPAVMVEADGTVLSADSVRNLTSVRVQQVLSLPAQCELAFTNEPGAPGPTEAIKVGASLRLSVGSSEPALFEGQVTAVEYIYQPDQGREIRVRAYDLLHQLRKRQTVRAHVQVTVEDLTRELTSSLGVDVRADESGPLWPNVIQHRQTDYELLVSLAERCGLFLALYDGTLNLITLEGMDGTVDLTVGENLLEARFEINGEPSCREVAAVGWDALKVESHEGNAASPRSGRDIATTISPEDVGAQDSRALVDEVTPDDAHAQGLAQSELDLRAAREVTFWGLAEGDPGLRPGGRIDVSGAAENLNGRYVLTRVTHTIDERMGFVSEIDTSPPRPSPRPRAAVATVGVVTRVDDSEGLGRVRASLPTYNDVETDWLGVLLPAAGKDKGIIALPDVGDHVLVLSIDGDPGRGFVLGGVYGTTSPPDTGVEGSAVKRYTLVTPGGQRLRLNDADTQVRLETSGGSYIDFLPGGVRLHAASDLTLEAPGHRVAIRGDSIEFERA